jgi:hypothetical protein
LAKAVAADALAGVDDGGAKPSVGGATLQKSDVGGHAPQGGEVHGDAFHL